ncbi:hypothetical protein AHAS_AhasUnG0036200 [Arachis hypogaea]
MEEIMSVQVVEESTSGTLALDFLARCFSDLHERYADSYKLCNLSCIACSYALPLFIISVFQDWDPLRNPSYGLELGSTWKTLLQGKECLDIWDISSPYTQLVSMLPAVRISGVTWQACCRYLGTTSRDYSYPHLGASMATEDRASWKAQQKAATYAQQQAVAALGGANANGVHDLSLKEVIEAHAQHHGLLFKIKPGRMHNGHQIYGFSNVSIIIDSLHQKVYAQHEETWSLESLQGLLELHNKSLGKRH